ncbi:MAG: amidohydrolase family protein, partial [Burkholderiales bacterium]
PSHEPIDWFLTNKQKGDARERVNKMAGGTKRAMAHLIFRPGVPGDLETYTRELSELKPDSIKGYTIGDNTNKPFAPNYAWRMDDEKKAYPYYERAAKAGIKNVCVHKGLFPPSTTAQFPNLLGYANVEDVAKAAKDWPQLNFIIYHSAYRFAAGGTTEEAWNQIQSTGRIDWVSDLADIPSRYGVNNVYGDLGQIFAQSTMANPNVCAFMMGTLVKGLGVDRVVWGTDAIWTGSPQWQIESLRRLEIPADMQKKYGFAALGAADGPIKSAIFGGNNARLYSVTAAQRAALDTDKFVEIKRLYAKVGEGRTNLAYGYVAPKA